MAEKRKKIRRSKKLILKKYSFEFLILFLIISGIFLLVEKMEIKSTFIYYIKLVFNSIIQFLQSIASVLSEFVKTREGSDIIGMGLLFTAFLLIYFRYRKMALTEWNSGENCLECETKMVRKRKEAIHRILSKLLILKVRHYFCEKCKSSKLNFK